MAMPLLQINNLKLCPKLEVYSISELLGEAINRIVDGRSLSELF